MAIFKSALSFGTIGFFVNVNFGSGTVDRAGHTSIFVFFAKPFSTT